MQENKRKPTIIDPALNEKPVYFYEEDFDKQQMACELMDLRGEIARLKKELFGVTELATYWQEQVLAKYRLRATELNNKDLYNARAEEGF